MSCYGTSKAVVSTVVITSLLNKKEETLEKSKASLIVTSWNKLVKRKTLIKQSFEKEDGP